MITNTTQRATGQLFSHPEDGILPKHKAILTCRDEPIISKGGYGMALHCNFSLVLRGYLTMLYKVRSDKTGRRENHTIELGRLRNPFCAKAFALQSSHTPLQGRLCRCSHRKQADVQGKSVRAQASSRSFGLVLNICFASGNYREKTHMILSTGNQ